MTTTEVQFCERLRAWGEGLGFLVYPEVSGWDLVFVSADHDINVGGKYGREIVEVGRQIGIHAKLRANCDVLHQAMPGYGNGPAFPMVAVPRCSHAFVAVAARLHVGVLEETEGYGAAEMPFRYRGHWHAPRGGDQLTLPPIASRAIAAGSPCPRVLSPWRVKALRFLAFARARGEQPILASDLKAHGISKDWIDKWLQPVDWTYADNPNARSIRRVVKVRTYRLTTDPQALPDFGYEGVAAELAAKDAA